jgi:hypothetical protein
MRTTWSVEFAHATAMALACLAWSCGGGGGGDLPDASKQVDARPPADARSPDAGPTWTCNPAYYNAHDGCDCDCGIWDPDCGTAGPVFNCGSAVAPYCNANATCGDYCNGTPVNGACVGSTTVASCFISEQSGVQPQVQTSTCPSSYACVQGSNGAQCELSVTCVDGSTYCSNANTLQTCSGGNYTPTSCAANACLPNPGLGAACAPGPVVATITGRVQYEFRQRLSNLSGFGGLVVGDAASMLAAVIDNGVVLGSGYETIALPLSYSGGRAQFVQEAGQPRKRGQLCLGMREAIRLAA